MTRSLFKRKPVARWATIALGISTSLAALGAASAQTPAAATGESDTPDRVIVTGSNIPSAAEAGAAPVTTLDAAAIGRTGVDDAQVSLIKSEPSFSGGGNYGQNNSSVASNTTQGGSAISLRGLQTLVLLNGRRVADSAASASGGAQFQDVNLFPTALIKRIEVLKDGASAIYGSDAVGGVVNVILQDDFKGAAFSGRYGFTEKSDITDQRFSGVVGFGDEHTRIVVAAQYREQDPVYTRDRAIDGGFAASQFATNVGGFTGTSSNFGGRLVIAGSSRFLNTGLSNPILPGQVATNLNSPNQVLAPASIAPIFNASGQQVFSYTVPGVAGTPTIGGNYDGSRSLVLSQYTSLTNDASSTSAYGSVERDIFDKHLIAFGDFLYTKNFAQSFLAPQPVTTGSSPLVTQNMIIALGAPYNPFDSVIGQSQAAVGGTATGTGGITVTNRFQSAPRVFREDTQFYRFVGGLKGEIVKDLNYEVAFNHSEDQIDSKTFNLVRADLLNQALAGGFNADGTAAPATFTTLPVPGSTTGATYQSVVTAAGPYSRVNNVLLPALDAFALNNPASTERAILGTQIQDQQSKLTVIDGKLNGFPVKLPAGPLGFAIGGEYRREELRLNTSLQSFVASVPTADVQIGRGVEAGYVELSVPVISPEMKIPGIYSLDLDGAGRVEKYDDTNSNFVPKASFVLRPVVDVAVRGTYSKSFNEPNLILTNGPATSGFTSLVNLGGGFSEQANAINTSNPNLGPVRTDTYSTGVVLSPHQVPGLTLTADFFHIEQKGIVTAGPSATTILLQENTLGAASPYNSLVHFASATGPNLTSTAPNQLRGNAANYFVVTTLNNNSRLRESGIDFTVNYDHDFGPKFGGITLGLNGTYYLQYKENDNAGLALYDVIGLYNGGIGSSYVPEYKLVPYVEYRYGGAQVSALANYIPPLRDAASSLINGLGRNNSYTQDGGPNLPKIRDYFTIDLTASYEFGLNKVAPQSPVPAPKDGKDGKGGGKTMVASEMTKPGFNYLSLLDGLKVTLGVNNVTNARPPFIAGSPDSSNTDVSIYDPYQRLYYFTISKKF